MAKKDKKGKGKRKVKKKRRITVDEAIVHIKSSFNNTIITITDKDGNVILSKSGGKIGYIGSKKGTAFSAQLCANQIADEAVDMGIKRVEVWIKGPGSGREAALRTLKSSRLEVTRIKEVTKVPHNGCRPKKRRGL